MNARSRRLRFFSLALAVLGLCMVLLCGCRPAEEKADSSPAELPVIVVGSDNYPPFNYTGSDGQPTGVDVELAQEAFRRLGYRVQFVTINWEEKKTLVENGTIDCAWGSFSMNGREDEYTWAGPYLHSRQVVQSTTKPEELFLDAAANGLPQLRAVYSLQDRDLIYTTLIKGYADALAAHESAIRQFMKDYSVEYRILAEPLMQADLGVAFAKDRADDLPQRLTETFREMLADGTTREIVSRYLDEPDHYLEGMGGSSDD
ncbi:MAG TPA: amino acid ABC transporter substrate-binding protein [Faecalibacterium sp.]|nr:amino acid ABC transporter substrate-binding protein [Faecalibacterium sp.]